MSVRLRELRTPELFAVARVYALRDTHHASALRLREAALEHPLTKQVQRREFLRSVALAAGSLAFACTPKARDDDRLGPAPAAAGKLAAEGAAPNIVLIMADDLGVECLGSYGGLSYQTPFLDRLAETGMRFAHCYSQPVCTPSRVQLATGRYNHRNYVGFGQLNAEEITFANVLRQVGYKACIAGKWQLGADRRLVGHFGFDEYCLWWLENKSPRYFNVGELIQNGEVLPGGQGEYGPDVISAFVLDFIARHKNEPFLCYYPMLLPHDPFEATPRSAKRSGAGEATYFADMVQYLDEIVGRIVRLLDDLDIREQTLILFTSDNGTHRGIVSKTTEGQVLGGKGKMTDAGTHVPLIANRPSTIPADTVCEDLVDFSDFFPTLLEAAGARPPDDRVIDGRSFLDQLYGRPGNPREWVFCHYEKRGRGKTRQYARGKRWKLYDNGRLYDLAADPFERSPLRKLMPEARAARQRLREAFIAVGSERDPMRGSEWSESV